MSQGSQSQLLDDVPVALTDKWKPPPLPTITEDMVERFFLPRLGPSYDYTLEKKVLTKISNYESARREAVEAREERIRHRHDEKVRRQEAEGTRLREKLTALSYPSPDEFSSSDDEGKTRQPIQNRSSWELLTPTVASKVTSMPTSNGNATQLELADFEKASDPFDCVELKTIDDLDILAQVLGTSHSTTHSKETTPPTEKIKIVKEEYQNGESDYAYQHYSQHHLYYNMPVTSYVTNYAPYHSNIVESEALRLKSKSVPDLVKELEAEVNDSQRRIRNNSQSIETQNSSGMCLYTQYWR